MSLSTLKDGSGPDEMKFIGTFNLVVIHDNRFVIGSETRVVYVGPPKKVAVDKHNVPLQHQKVSIFHDCIVARSGCHEFTKAATDELRTTLLEREDKRFPPLTSAQTSIVLQQISKEQLKKRADRGEETPRSTLIICKYDLDGPKMVKLIIDKGEVTVGVTPEKWAIGGKATEQTCAKIYKYLADNLKDDEDEKTSLKRVAHVVNICTKMASTYSEIKKKEEDDNSIGGISTVYVVQEEEEEPIGDLQNRHLAEERFQNLGPRKMTKYNFGEIAQSRQIFVKQ